MLDAQLEKKLAAGERLTRQECENIYRHASHDDLKKWATLAKSRFHTTDSATYLIMAIVNYTNICVAKCDYCSFYKLPHQEGTYHLSDSEIFAKLDTLLAHGGTMVGFNGGFHPKLKIIDYAKLFQKVRHRYGDDLQFYGMTVAEFMFSAKLSKMPYVEAATVLKDHGTEWVTGGGAEILDDDFRMRHSPGKFKVDDYFKAQQAILTVGMGSTATMVIGFDETLEERFNHLEKLRDFQDANKHWPLTSFLCWTYKPYNNELGGAEISSEEYWRWLAVSRLYLDNIKHIRTSVLTKNQDALVGLQYGANDFDLPTEDEVTQKAGATIEKDFAGILQSARDLGIEPIHRAPFKRVVQ